jgi:hypothetical protein
MWHLFKSKQSVARAIKQLAQEAFNEKTHHAPLPLWQRCPKSAAIALPVHFPWKKKSISVCASP